MLLIIKYIIKSKMLLLKILKIIHISTIFKNFQELLLSSNYLSQSLI